MTPDNFAFATKARINCKINVACRTFKTFEIQDWINKENGGEKKNSPETTTYKLNEPSSSNIDRPSGFADRKIEGIFHYLRPFLCDVCLAMAISDENGDSLNCREFISGAEHPYTRKSSAPRLFRKGKTAERELAKRRLKQWNKFILFTDRWGSYVSATTKPGLASVSSLSHIYLRFNGDIRRPARPFAYHK